MITFEDSADGVSPEQLRGFFVGWPDPPSPRTLLRLLGGSAYVVLALDDANGRVIGLITAVTDGVLAAYVPLLEVLPNYQQRGIGSELVRRMLDRLRDVYMVDLLCDAELQPWYSGFGMQPATGMLIRRYDRQAGKP